MSRLVLALACALLLSGPAGAQTLDVLGGANAEAAAEADATRPEAIAARRAEVAAQIESLSAAAAADTEAGERARARIERLTSIDGLLQRESALATADASPAGGPEIPEAIVPTTRALDALYELRFQHERRAERSAHAVEEARAALARARDRLETAAKKRRLARKTLEESAASEHAAASDALAMADLAYRKAQETVHLRTLETRAAVAQRDAPSRSEQIEDLIARTREAIAQGEGGPSAVSDAFVDDRTAWRRARDANARELATAELWLTAAEKRFAEQKRPTPELVAEIEALRVRRDALRQRQTLFEADAERADAQSEIYRRWEELLRVGAPREELAVWETDVAVELEALEQRELERVAWAADLESRIGSAELRQEKAAPDSPLQAVLAGEVAALAELRRTVLDEIEAISADRRLVERFVADIQAHTGHIDPLALLADGRQAVRELWTYEITSVDESPITVGSLVLALVLFAAGLWVSRLGATTMARWASERLKLDAGAAHAVQTLSFYTLLVSFTLLALRAVHFPLTAFTVLGGAVAIGIGFGSQNVMNNFISGLILMLERPVRVRDVVEIDGSHGAIEKIGARSTQIRSTDGRHVIVPNSFFLENNVINWTLSDELIRTRVRVGVIYGSPTRLVEDLIRRVVQEEPLVIQDPKPIVIFDEFGDNSLNFDVYFWVRARAPMQVRQVESRIRFRIDDLFRENGLVIAFPQRDVHLDTVAPLEVRILEAARTSPESDPQDD